MTLVTDKEMCSASCSKPKWIIIVFDKYTAYVLRDLLKWPYD